MGLFKDFKEDFSQAVDELIPGGEDFAEVETSSGLMMDALDEAVDVESELSKLDGLLEQPALEPVAEPAAEVAFEPAADLDKEFTATPSVAPMKKVETVKENKRMSDLTMNTAVTTDETSVITASTVLTGDLQSSGSFEIQGTINGNVTCNGKLTVTGTINGNSNASEFFADVAKIEGEVVSTGTVKVGTGSVIIGNITASSAVIAGAVKGDIDVQGPVVVDTSAVIMGNIKSRSVQINNGAVIEGFCSQCYADIDVQGLFETK